MNTIQAPPQTLASLPITVLMNPASGQDDKHSSREQIVHALQAAGREHTLEFADAAGLSALAARVVAEAEIHPRIVVAAGGDGTINAVAGCVIGSGVPFGVIPLGTFNYFARDLGIPQDAAEATRALLGGHLRSAHVATINDRLFLINSSIGMYRRIQEERERFKQRFGRSRFIAALSGLWTLLREHRNYDVRMSIDGRSLRLHTPMILFDFNRLQLEQLDLEVADCTRRGQLAMLVLRPMSRLRLLGFALRGALYGLGDEENLVCHCAARVEVHLRRARRVKVAIDGEMVECSLPLRVEIVRDALDVIVPSEPVPRA